MTCERCGGMSVAMHFEGDHTGVLRVEMFSSVAILIRSLSRIEMCERVEPSDR
jgi:hypothetical protein